MPAIDWGAVFMFSMSPVELIVRGTLVYWFLFCIFRFFLHRDVGELGIADLLVLVIIADASQNAMGSEYKSVSDGFVLIATIASWSYLFNFLSFRYPRFRRFTAPGPLCLVRDGRRQSLTVTVGQRPTDEQLAEELGVEDDGTAQPEGGAPVPPQQALGLSLQSLTPQLGTAVGLPADARGVIITAVDASSDAAEKGLQRGDLIVSVNQQPVTTPAQVMAIVETARRAGRTSVLLLVKRGRGPEAFFGVEIGGR